MSQSDSALEHADAGANNDLAAQYTLDDYFLDRAIDLAWLGAGGTYPNPLVGALVVKDGRIIGVGYHQKYGEAHAETIALERAGRAARGATLFVTLEPCAHEGNTPPCADQVLKSGVKRVVIPTLDPDERVNGRGVRILRDGGVEVVVGRRVERAMLLNMIYFKRALGLGTTVTLKMAITLDGRIASRPLSRDEISGEEAHRFVHQLRAIHDGVLVGINTLLVDSPRLDCRLFDTTRLPAALVLDSKLRFPVRSPLLGGDRTTVIVTTDAADGDKAAKLSRAGALVLRCPSAAGRVAVTCAIDRLAAKGVSSCLVEGGAEVFSSFIATGAWDGMHLFVSPVLFGPGGVGLSSLPLDRSQIGAVNAGVSASAGDVLLNFVNEKTRKRLLEYLL